MTRRKHQGCAACGIRVRRKQPYVIAVSRESGKESYYHCRLECQEQATRHRAVLEELVALHEEQAEKYREQPKGA